VYPPPETLSGPFGVVNVPESVIADPPVSVNVPETVSADDGSKAADCSMAAAAPIVNESVPLAPPVPVSVPEYVTGVVVPFPGDELELHPTPTINPSPRAATIAEVAHECVRVTLYMATPNRISRRRRLVHPRSANREIYLENRDGDVSS
jgi:hypothetical protein